MQITKNELARIVAANLNEHFRRERERRTNENRRFVLEGGPVPEHLNRPPVDEDDGLEGVAGAEPLDDDGQGPDEL